MVDVNNELRALWNRVLPEPDGDDFFDSGGTSINAVHLAASIQEELSVAVNAIEVVRLGTLARLVELVQERLSEGRVAGSGSAAG